MTATALRDSKGPRRGVVLVIEDLSELLAAQRAAAWSEVARRMAHEIKNPLTPIQLSAERIAKSYARAAGNGGSNGCRTEEGPDEKRVAAVISECTETITREVAGLKAMVDEFSRFARLPATRLEARKSQRRRHSGCRSLRRTTRRRHIWDWNSIAICRRRCSTWNRSNASL